MPAETRDEDTPSGLYDILADYLSELSEEEQAEFWQNEKAVRHLLFTEDYFDVTGIDG